MKNLIEFYSSLERGGKKKFCLSVAKEAGLSVETVLKWMQGWRTPKDPKVLEILSRQSGVPVEQLF